MLKLANERVAEEGVVQGIDERDEPVPARVLCTFSEWRGVARRDQYTFLEKKVPRPNSPCGGTHSSPATSAQAALFRHAAAGALTVAGAASAAADAVALSAASPASAWTWLVAASYSGTALFLPLAVALLLCFCSAAACCCCCSLLRLSCQTGLALPRRMPFALRPALP